MNFCVNIPAAGAPFGKFCRSLFVGDDRPGAPARVISNILDPETQRVKKHTNHMEVWNDKKKCWEDEEDGHLARYYIKKNHDAFVGGDGAGLELRMLTHYLIWVCKFRLQHAKTASERKKYQAGLDSAYEYRRVLLEDDIHSHNQKLAGLPTRKSAKGFIYAFLYGAGDAKLAELVNGKKADGTRLRKTFLKECPCIPLLIEWAQENSAKGWLPAIDGRRLIMRRDFRGEVMTHKALNTLLQAAGSIVMKYSGVFLDNWIKKDKLDTHEVIMMHDEYQFSCKWEDVPKLRAHIDDCVRAAGDCLKMECPLASDSMVGSSWLETH